MHCLVFHKSTILFTDPQLTECLEQLMSNLATKYRFLIVYVCQFYPYGRDAMTLVRTQTWNGHRTSHGGRKEERPK